MEALLRLVYFQMQQKFLKNNKCLLLKICFFIHVVAGTLKMYSWIYSKHGQSLAQIRKDKYFTKKMNPSFIFSMDTSPGKMKNCCKQQRKTILTPQYFRPIRLLLYNHVTVLHKSLSSDNIKHCFEKTSLVPFNPQVVLEHIPLYAPLWAKKQEYDNQYETIEIIQYPVIQHPVIQHPVIQPPIIQPPIIQYPVIQPPLIQHPVIQPPVIPPTQPPQIPQQFSKWTLMQLTPNQQKQYIGEFLYTKISTIDEPNVGKITGMILELDIVELINLL
ncbi:MAG: hypothetical protein EZS28_024247, partial [Streblomastix strix]